MPERPQAESGQRRDYTAVALLSAIALLIVVGLVTS